MRWTRPVPGVTTARTGEPNGNGGRPRVAGRDHLPTRSGGSTIFGAAARGMHPDRAEAAARTATGAGAPRQQTGALPVTVTKKKA